MWLRSLFLRPTAPSSPRKRAVLDSADNELSRRKPKWFCWLSCNNFPGKKSPFLFRLPAFDISDNVKFPENDWEENIKANKSEKIIAIRKYPEF